MISENIFLNVVLLRLKQDMHACHIASVLTSFYDGIRKLLTWMMVCGNKSMTS